MIILDSTVRALKVGLTSATANNQQITAHYIDTTSSASTPGSSTTQTNGLTPVTAVSAPGASTQRAIKLLTINDVQAGGTTQALYTQVYYDDNGTTRYLWIGRIPCGGTLVYEDGAGWYVLDWRGHIQYSAAPAYLSANAIRIGSHRNNAASSSVIGATAWSYWQYVGRATGDHNSVDVLYEVVFSGTSRTSAYILVGRGDPDPGNTVNGMCIGRTDVNADWGSTGIKKTNVTLTGCKVGDHIWVGWYNTFSGASASLRCTTVNENATGTLTYGLSQGAGTLPAVGGTFNLSMITNNPPMMAVQFIG